MCKRIIAVFTAASLIVSLMTAAAATETHASNNAHKMHTTTIVADSLDYDTVFWDWRGHWENPNHRTVTVTRSGKVGLADAFTGEIIIPPVYDEITSFNKDGYAQVKQNGKYGIVNQDNKLVVPIIYDGFNSNFGGLATNDGYIVVHVGKVALMGGCCISGGKKGIVSLETGEVVVPVIYDRLFEFRNGLARVGIGKTVPSTYEYSSGFFHDCSGEYFEGKWGYVNTNGEVAIPLIYDFAENFGGRHGGGDYGYAIVAMGTPLRLQGPWGMKGQYGVINTKGEVVVPLEYDEIGNSVIDGVVIVGKGKWVRTPDNNAHFDGNRGLLNMKGEFIVPFEYNRIDDFAPGVENTSLARLQKDGKWGVINTAGEFYLPVEYDRIDIWHNGNTWDWFLVIKGSENFVYNIADRTLTMIVPEPPFPDWEDYSDRSGIYGTNNELWRVKGKTTNKWGIVDRNGEIVVPLIYDNIGFGWDVSDGLISVGMLNEDWDADWNPDWGERYPYWTSYKYGFINLKGEVVIPIEYDYVTRFSEGFAAVAKITDVIEHVGDWYFGPTYTWTEPVYKFGIIDTENQVLVPFEYDLIWNFKGGVAQVGKGSWRKGDDPPLVGGKWGFVNTKGELLTPVIYGSGEGFEFDDLGLTFVSSGDNWQDYVYGVINKNGEVLISVKYERYNTYGWHDTLLWTGRSGNTAYYWLQRDDGPWQIVAITLVSEEKDCEVCGAGVVCSCDCSCGVCGDCDPPCECGQCRFCKPCCNRCRSRPTAGKLGHVLGNATVSTSDALEILKYIVNLNNIIKDCDNARRAATIVGNTITTADALEILKKLVSLPNRIDGVD